MGMGKALAERLPKARELFDRAAEILGYDLAELCFSGPTEKLDSTVHSQPALFVCSLCALESLRDQNPQIVADCQACAGLSLGEYTALAFAGVFDFETALRLVAERGAAMQAASDAAPSGMVSVVGLERGHVEALCDRCRGMDVLNVANLLCPGNIVVSGSKAACQRVLEQAESAGAMKAIPLAVAGAFHTSLMASALERLQAALAKAQLSRPRVPVYSNVDARTHDDPEEIRQLLIRQVVQPVLWEDCVRNLLAAGGDQFHEIGPGRVLRGLLRRIDRKLDCQNVEC